MADRILALDVDDVLLDFFEGFLPFMASQGHRVQCAPHEVRDFDMADALPDLSLEERLAAIPVFSESEAFENIPPAAGAVEVMAGLRAEHPDLKVIAITACGAGPQTRVRRIRNLERHFVLDDIVTLPLGASKEAELRKLPRGTVFVDDMIKHVNTAEACGLLPILFRRGHNSTISYHRVAEDWRACRDIMSELLGTGRVPKVA